MLLTSRSRLLPAVAVAVLAADVGCSSGASPAGSTSVPAAAPDSSASVAPSVVTPSVTGPSAPDGEPTDAAGRASQWYAGLQTRFAAIQRDTEQIAADAGKQDVSALGTHCAQLQADAVQVQAARAAPDKRIAAAVATAMQWYERAAQSCLKGDFGGAADGIDKGGSALQSANSIMNNLS